MKSSLCAHYGRGSAMTETVETRSSGGDAAG